MLKVYVAMFIITLGCGIAGSAYFLWNDMQEQVRILSVQKETLENAMTEQEQTIEGLQTANREIQSKLESTYNDLSQARRNVEILEEKLEKNDLGLLAQRKPGLVENVINNASDKALRCFELMTGSELTEAERNAKNGKEFNSECPWLYDSLISP